jgi:hypothetical protein
MRFWGREIAGWLLVGAGLFVFYVCVAVLLNDPSRILEAGPLTLIGIIVFRGGIHLLKVAVAARICMKAPMTLPPRGGRGGRPGDGQQPLEW